MRTSTIFKNRWLALVWATGIIWLAYDFAVPDDSANGNEVQITDASGAPVSADEAKQLEQALNGF